jgi:hypothetical protein
MSGNVKGIELKGQHGKQDRILRDKLNGLGCP